MSTHTAAEQACFDALVAHNTPMDRDGGHTYPSCLWPIAEAAVKAVRDADEAELERHRQAAQKLPPAKRCQHTSSHRNQDGEPVCDDCGWMP